MAQSYVVRGTNAMYSQNEIINEQNVVLEISDWDFSDRDPQTIRLKVRVLTGIKKGKDLSDLVTFDPDAPMNWKYKALRSAIGVPIPKDSEDAFDLIELVGKRLLGDLIKSKDGKYQNIGYKRYDADAIDILLGSVEEPSVIDTPEFTEEPNQIVSDDDLPF